VVTPYSPGPDGQMVPSMPLFCIDSSRSSACQIVKNHARCRKAGPAHPLFVVRCTKHDRAFTLYPPGWFPYGRVACAALDPSGRPIRRGDVSADTLETLFTASRDASQGQLWPRLSSSSAPGVYKTQQRRIAQSASLLGLVPTDGSQPQDAVAEALRLPTLTLRTAASSYSSCSSTRDRGRAVLALLEQVSLDVHVGDPLYRAGYRSGLWRCCCRWRPGGPVGPSGLTFTMLF